MADVEESRPTLRTDLADNLLEQITAQDLRNFLRSTRLLSEEPRQHLYGDGLASPYDVSPYDVTFDSTDGYDGLVVSVVVPGLLEEDYPLVVRVGRETYVPFADYTVAPVGSNTVVTFASGTHPVAGSIVTVIATPAVS